MLAAGIQAAAPEAQLTVVANTADDDEFWGLLVCPDIDAVIYRLAGVFNDAGGFGVRDDTFHALGMLERMGGETWFRLGDRDLALHLLRTEALRDGATLTAATLDLCRRLGLRARVLPMCDEPVRTRFATDAGELSFQEYFVRERLQPRLRGIRFAGVEGASPTRELASALEDADVVVIGPSNPLISIAPILRIAGDLLPRARTVAVSPIVAGTALKGPTVEMMRALGHEAVPETVARMYRDVAAVFVLDERDRGSQTEVEGLGYRVEVCDTVMNDGGVRLARAVLSAV